MCRDNTMGSSKFSLGLNLLIWQHQLCSPVQWFKSHSAVRHVEAPSLQVNCLYFLKLSPFVLKRDIYQLYMFVLRIREIISSNTFLQFICVCVCFCLSVSVCVCFRLSVLSLVHSAQQTLNLRINFGACFGCDLD